jgi:hypothetical protein
MCPTRGTVGWSSVTRAERDCTPEELLGCRRAVDVVDGAPPTLAGVLDLEEIDHDIVDSWLAYPDLAALYAGQAAAQALPAGDRTAADGRGPTCRTATSCAAR